MKAIPSKLVFLSSPSEQDRTFPHAGGVPCARNHLKRWSPALGNEGHSQQAGLPTFTPNKRTPTHDGVACAWNYLKRWSHALDIEGHSQQAGLPTYTRWVGISSAWKMPPLHGTTSNGGPLRWIMKAIPSKLVFQLLSQTSGPSNRMVSLVHGTTSNGGPVCE